MHLYNAKTSGRDAVVDAAFVVDPTETPRQK